MGIPTVLLLFLTSPFLLHVVKPVPVNIQVEKIEAGAELGRISDDSINYVRTPDYDVDGEPKAKEEEILSTSEEPRTIVMVTIIRWMIGVFKSMVKPARDLYLAMTPEIAVMRCLSQSRDLPGLFRNVFRGDGPDEQLFNSEGHLYETPRSWFNESSPGGNRDLNTLGNGMIPPPPDQVPYDPTNQRIAGRRPKLHDDVPQLSTSAREVDPSEKLLRRIPRFVREVASVLQGGESMGCVVPYVRERVTRWLDN